MVARGAALAELAEVYPALFEAWNARSIHRGQRSPAAAGMYCIKKGPRRRTHIKPNELPAEGGV